MKLYTSAEIVALTGLTYRQVDHYGRRGYVQPVGLANWRGGRVRGVDVERPGPGYSKLWDAAALRRFQDIRDLGHLGLRVDKAVVILDGDKALRSAGWWKDRQRMRALDLFCGGGGAAEGLIRSGYEVTGVDNDPRHASVYPGTFIHADVADLDPDWIRGFDFVWASPPCQAFSYASRADTRHKHPNLIPLTRELIAGHPRTVIENVPRAPIRVDLILTGPMVGLPNIYRRRLFELSWWIGLQPPLQKVEPWRWKAGKALTVTKRMCATTHWYPRKALGLPGQPSVEEARAAMGITLPLDYAQIGEAVPPAYAQWIADRAP